jgi:hypothetical protein
MAKDAVTAVPVPLSELERDLPVPVDGWAAELGRRGVEVVEDDLGRAAVDRVTARLLFTEARENEARVARHRLEVEQLAIAADAARRAAIPRGVPVVGAALAEVSAPERLMLADPPDREQQRESVLQHALSGRDGLVYTPVAEDAP